MTATIEATGLKEPFEHDLARWMLPEATRLADGCMRRRSATTDAVPAR